MKTPSLPEAMCMGQGEREGERKREIVFARTWLNQIFRFWNHCWECKQLASATIERDCENVDLSVLFSSSFSRIFDSFPTKQLNGENLDRSLDVGPFFHVQLSRSEFGQRS